jgi:hypothetical protein
MSGEFPPPPRHSLSPTARETSLCKTLSHISYRENTRIAGFQKLWLAQEARPSGAFSARFG